MNSGVGCRHSWDPVLLWLWRRPAAVAQIQPLAWELLYAVGMALKNKKQNKTKQKKKSKTNKQKKKVPLSLALMNNFQKDHLVLTASHNPMVKGGSKLDPQVCCHLCLLLLRLIPADIHCFTLHGVLFCLSCSQGSKVP